jgi:gamma-glutamyltranspeptidase/glutathione hydrolase
VIGEQGGRRFAFGASGGRKIVSAVAQLSAFVVDHGMDVEAAFHQPRIDVSGGETVVADARHTPETLTTLAQGFDVVTAPRTVYPFAFACPAGVMREGDTNTGCTETQSPWGDAATEDDAR